MGSALMDAIEAAEPVKKSSAKSEIEAAAPKIREKIRQGVSLKRMYQIVKANGGFERLSFGTFKTYLYGAPTQAADGEPQSGAGGPQGADGE